MATSTKTVSGNQAAIKFDDTNDWGLGFTADITITNRAATTLKSWVLDFDLANLITNIWGAEIVSHVGSHYVIRNLSWNATLAAGASLSFGFQANGGNPVLPSVYNLNGASVGGATPLTPSPTPAPVPPILSIANAAAVTEDGSATKPIAFVVTLSAPSATTVTVAYRTSDGTATAGSDYNAAQGTLTFAPGQTTQAIEVLTHPGTAGTESFSLDLSSPSGASISQAHATGSITNPAAVPVLLPTLRVQDVTVHEAAPTTGISSPAGAGALLPAGFLSTSGNQIVSSSGAAVKIAAVNWFGMETGSYAPHGLDQRSYTSMMDQMVTLGFNAIRLPFSDQLFDAGSTPNGIDFSKNPDLQGLSGLQIMDKIVSYAGKIGLKIILDHHRSAAGGGPNGNGLWYDSGYSEARWQSDWTMLASRYAGNSTVIGGDLANEPHGAATWGDGSANDWAAAATRAGNAIQAVNPNWLVFIEGIEQYQGTYDWWGGNLMGVKDHPISLNTPGKVVYSPHDYPASVYGQPWFSAADYPANLPNLWNRDWGYLYKDNIAPVWVGEFGTTLQTASDQTWLAQLVKYMDGDLSASGGPAVGIGQQGISWAYWSWNPDSGDTGGILANDWITVEQAKLTAVQPAQYHPAGSAGPTVPAAATPDALFTIGLSAASTQTVTVHYATVDGSAHAGTDYVATSGDLVFAPGDTVKVVTAHLLNPVGASGQMQFMLALSGPSNATLAGPAGTATIVHDPSASATPTSTPAPPPLPTAAGSVAVHVDADWGSGVTATVTVSNNGNVLAHGRQVKLTTQDVITSAWNGTILSHTANTYLIAPASFNQDVTAHGSASFGFQATQPIAGTPITAQLVTLGSVPG